jgi:hypothetical protein
MPNHYIVPAPGQQFAPVVRRVVLIGRSVGENVRIDKSMPTPRLLVGDKTLARWHELNAVRKAADVEAAANVAQRRAEAAAAASAVVSDEPPAEPVNEGGAGDQAPRVAESAPVEDAPPASEPEVEVEEKAPAKKATSRKRKSTSNR